MLTAAIVSDIHALAGVGPPEDSHVQLATRGDPRSNPLAGLKALIERDELRADVLLVPGDVSNKAETDALNYAWTEIGLIQDLLSASLTIATVGNHDVDSRFIHNDFDARGALLELRPLFPVNDIVQANAYWSRNVTLVTGEKWRIVVLNSSAYHGYQDEDQQGRIADSTLNHIDEIISDASYPLNILVTHHHPQPWTHLDAKDQSQMQGGDRLVELLDRPDQCQWVLIHGHKHFPALGYLGASSDGPVRFAAGSVGAKLYAELATAAANQFYIVTFDQAAADTLGLPVAGRFTAWDWATGDGWVRPTARSGLPGSGGFGYRRPGATLAQEIVDLCGHLGERTLRWERVVSEAPVFDYVVPRDLRSLEAALVGNHGGRVFWDNEATIMEVALP